MEVTGIADGLTGLTTDPNQVWPLGLLDVQDVHALGGTILGTSNKGSPFRKKAEAARILKIFSASFAAQRLDALLVIGGDGTHFMARHLSEAGFGIVGIPKTIDNDLIGSDLTIGFRTAVDTAVDAAERLRTSAAAHNRCMVLEVMGRDAGHIALETGIAAGANAVLLPEQPFDFARLAAKIEARKALGRESFLIVCAEGAHPTGAKRLYKEEATLGGIGQLVAQEVMKRTRVDARSTALGHVQRGGTPNAFDRLLATRLGVHAVELIAKKKFGRVVGVRRDELIEIPYAKIADARRLVDMDGDVVHAAEASGIWVGRDSRYAASI